MTPNPRLICLIAFATSVGSGRTLLAQPAGPGGLNFWNEPVNGSWFDHLAWNGVLPSQGGVPTLEQTAHIAWDSAYTVTIQNGQGICHHLSIANSAATLQVRGAQGDASLWTFGTELNNDGLLLLGGSGAVRNSHLVINSNCTLRYAGILRLAPEAGGTARIVSPVGLGYLLVHENGHVIEGAGEIGVRLENNGLIQANVPGGKLTFNANWSQQNNATIRATAGGQVWLAMPSSPSGFEQSEAGEIMIEDGSSLWLQSAGLLGFSGGSLTTSGSGVIYVFAQGFSLENTTLTTGSRMAWVGNAGIHIGPAGMTNDGVMNLGATGFLASDVGESATLSGGGRAQLEGGQIGKFLDGFSYTIINGPEHTIGGIGTIQAHLINNGTIVADRNGLSSGPSVLQFQQAPKTNHGLISATGGGTINISSVSVTQSADGELHAGDGSSIAISSSTVTGGTLSTTGSGVIFANGSGETLADVTVAPGARIVSPCVRSLYLGGTVFNDGVITVDNAGCGPSFAYLRATGGAYVGGVGEIRLARTQTNASAFLAGDGGPQDPLILGPGQSLTGSGSITGAVWIEGTIAPDQPFGGGGTVGGFSGGAELVLTPTTTFECDLLSPATFDRITGMSEVMVDGHLAISLVGGYQPTLESAFTVISASSVAGEFESVQGPALPTNLAWRVRYGTTSVSVVVTCAADIDGDGITGLSDLARQLAHFGVSDVGGEDGDITGDGVIDIQDLAFLLSQFGLACQD